MGYMLFLLFQLGASGMRKMRNLTQGVDAHAHRACPIAFQFAAWLFG